PAGRAELEAGLAAAREINRQALAPLSLQEQETLRGLLARLI
ncbi:MarR family transcriptional regulator, partial [Pseudomonas aeruginosa]|nr:MarR family transcriptional regulator [Pseudomonas aeruginosa]